MRIGTSVAEPTPGPESLQLLRTQLATAAADGFSSAWMANIFGLDAITALAVAGSAVPDLEVGTAVVPTYPRHPVTLAQQALTADVALGGRLTLGIGLSHKIVIDDMFGYSFDRPARHMREYLSVLLPLLETGSVRYTGDTMRAAITLSTPRVRRIPVLLAALAPQMLHLAGAEADGTILWMTGPATVENHIVPLITKAAAGAGKPSPRVVCVLPVCVTNDVDTARERAATVFAIYGQLPSYRAMLDREGAGGPGDVAIVGDDATVAKQIEHLAGIGVTDFVAGEYGTGEDAVRTHELVKELAATR
jgi:F420-dependent oxidoreductase-like protein